MKTLSFLFTLSFACASILRLKRSRLGKPGGFAVNKRDPGHVDPLSFRGVGEKRRLQFIALLPVVERQLEISLGTQGSRSAGRLL